MEKGLVIKTTGSWHTVKTDAENVDCKIKGKYRIEGFRATNPVAVGDWVDFKRSDDESTAVITKIHKRKNYIIRKSTNLSKEVHILATNIPHQDVYC